MKKYLLINICCLLTLMGCRSKNPLPDGSGTIECTQVQVAPQVSGRLIKINAEEGSHVKKGDCLAEIDSKDFILRQNEAKAMLALAQAQLDLAIAGAREEDIQRAREQVREAKAAAQSAEADRKRMEAVFTQKSVTQKQWDDAKANAERTAAMLASAEASLAKLLAGSRKEELHMAQAAVDQAKARCAQLEKNIADCLIYAPMDGNVTTKNREAGEMINVGASILTLSRLDEVWLSVYIPETRLSKIKLGQKTQVKVDGDPQFYEGRITFISSEAEFTPKNVQTPEERAKLVYRVKITLPNPKQVFKPGMPADGYLLLAQ